MLLLRAKVLSPSLLPSLSSFSLPTSPPPSLPPSFFTILPWIRYGEAKASMERSQKGLYSLLGSQFLGQNTDPELGSVTRQRERGDLWASAFIVVSEGKNAWGRANRFRLANLNNAADSGAWGLLLTAWYLTLGQLKQVYVGPRVWELMEVNWLLERQKWPASSQCFKTG